MHRSIEDTFAIQHYLEIHFWMYPQSSIENTFIVLAENSESIFVLRLVVNLGMLKLWWGLKSDFGEETKISPQTIFVRSVLKLWRGVKSDFGEKDFTSDKLWWEGEKWLQGKEKDFTSDNFCSISWRKAGKSRIPRSVSSICKKSSDYETHICIMSAWYLYHICIISVCWQFISESKKYIHFFSLVSIWQNFFMVILLDRT